jgi:hypothetical protein
MTTPMPSDIPAYNVTGISAQQYQTDPAGNTQEGYIVHFQLQDGTQGQAFVPQNRWNPGNAEAAIVAEVKTLYHVRNLSAGM